MEILPINLANAHIFEVFAQDYKAEFSAIASNAIAFWRTTIGEYTKENYTEDQIHDLHWGSVLRQCFESRTKKR